MRDDRTSPREPSAPGLREPRARRTFGDRAAPRSEPAVEPDVAAAGGAIRIATVLPGYLATRLGAALTGGATRSPCVRVECRNLGELAGAVASGAASVAVVDPLLCQGPDTPRRVAEVSLAAVVVMYTEFTPVAARLAVEWAQRGARALVLAGIDDEPEQLRRLFAALPTDVAVHDFLARLATPLGKLPHPFAHALGRLFADPRAVPSVDALACSADATRRSLLRWLAHARLRGPKRLLVAAQLLRVTLLMRNGLTLGAAARALGYRSERTLALHVRDALALPPAELRDAPLPTIYDRLERFVRVDADSPA